MKTPYVYLYLEVEKLWDKSIKEHLKKEKSEDEINADCDFIEAFIKANGWSIDEFNDLYLSDITQLSIE